VSYAPLSAKETAVLRSLLTLAIAATLTTAAILPAAAAPVRHRSLTGAGLTGWAPTATLATVPKGTDLGALAGTVPLRLTVALRGNYAGAAAMVKHVYTKGDPLYHRFMTPQAFTAQYAATPAQANAVAAYLGSFGMSNVHVNATRMLVTAQTTAAAASLAFNTSIHRFNVAGTPIFSNVTPAEVPAALAGTVQAIGGLASFRVHTDNYAYKVPAAQILPRSVTTYSTGFTGAGAVPAYCNNPAEIWIPLAGYAGLVYQPSQTYPLPFCYPGWYTPNNFRLTYDDEANPTGANTTIADITASCVGGAPGGKTYGDGCLDDVTADLWESEYYDGVAQTPVADREVNPGVADSGGNSGEAEWDLDTQGAAGIAGGVKGMIYYNMADETLPDVTSALALAASDDSATVVNASLGLCEVIWQQQGLIAPTDFVLAEMMIQGQTATVSSGDSGSFCSLETNGLPGGIPDMEYPGSSPYALTVGGTSLMASSSSGQYDTEIAWYAGGGGMSLLEPQAPWQQAMIYNGTGQIYAVGNRTVPDIAMDADASTGIYYYQSGVPGVEGGTSLAAPLAEGVWARLESHHNNQLGSAAPSLYALYASSGGGILNQSVAATLTDLNNCTLGTVLGETGLTNPGACTVPPPPPSVPPLPSASNPLSPPAIGPFHDVIAGANGYGVAAPGYDLTTGMGSLDINQLFIAYGS
jgi:pseudomonalisin